MGTVFDLKTGKRAKRQRPKRKAGRKKQQEIALVTEANEGLLMDYLRDAHKPTVKGVCALLGVSRYTFTKARKGTDYKLHCIWLYITYYRHIGIHKERRGGRRSPIQDVFPYRNLKFRKCN